MVLLVQIPSDPLPCQSTTSHPPTYVVDAGFGLGVARPILLKENHVALGAALPEQNRLIRAAHPDSSLDETDPESKTLAARWFMQINLDNHGKVLPDGTWRTLYEFGEQEFFKEDLEALSFVVARREGGLFWDNVLAVIHTPLSVDTLGRKVMGRKKVTLREGNVYKVLREFKSEDDRIEALGDDFFIQVHGTDQYIKRPALLEADDQAAATLRV